MERKRGIEFLGMLVFFCLAAVPRPVSAQSKDPFEDIHKDLLRAADASLEEIRPARRASIQKESESGPAPDRTSRASIESVPLTRIESARRRMGVLGVDAARIFAEEGVPLELLTIAEVESGFDPRAVSPKGAKGLWQLMPATAERFGLRVENRMDERGHPLRATRAAARYLRELHDKFGDWLLALAAYNAGEARVSEAIERSGTRDFWQLAQSGFLPEETRAYVPAVLHGRSGGPALASQH